MIKLIVEAKEPVYAELGAEPTGYQVMFGPDRDADNSAWVPQGARPAASASLILSPEAAEAFTVGSAHYFGADENSRSRNTTLGEALDDPNDDRASWPAEPVHPDTADADQKVATAVPDGEPVPFTNDGHIDGGTLSESGSDVPPVTSEPDTQPPAKATAKTRQQ